MLYAHQNSDVLKSDVPSSRPYRRHRPTGFKMVFVALAGLAAATLLSGSVAFICLGGFENSSETHAVTSQCYGKNASNSTRQMPREITQSNYARLVEACEG